MREGRLGITVKTADTGYCRWTYGLIQDFTVGNAWKYWWMSIGYRQEWK